MQGIEKVKKTIIIILIAILSLLAPFVLLVDWMTRYAYDRKSPKMPRFLVNIFMGRQNKDQAEKDRIRKQAEELEEKAKTRVEMTSYDGIVMVGHYYPCDDPERFVIACHGWRSGWEYDYRTIAPFLHDHKTSVLMIDLRGHRESGDRYLYYGKKERFDIACWTNYAAEHLAPELPIYVMGMSAGALCTLMSLTAGLHPNTKGVISDSGAGSARALGMSVVKNLKINPRILYPFIRLDARIRLGMDDNAYTAEEAMKANRLPILFIHGTKDAVADIRSMEKLYDLCPSPKFKLIVEGAGHMQSCFQDPDAYMEKLLEFFDFCEGR
ncbi:MAG: alpha/beta fold hydrolase [Parasporobacterium sp.]|nr:alpha/beta fold hydrolase [Parasporobacterium sp.]